MKDYRCTQYCPDYKDIDEQKKELNKRILQEYPRQKDMHALIRKNDCMYKKMFMNIYNNKCAYCGISVFFNPKQSFEIDHFICKTDSRFGDSKAKAGGIKNIVLACERCNGNKRDFRFSDAMEKTLFPDGDAVGKVFTRNDNYEIVVSESYKDNEEVSEYYKQMKFYEEIHRLNYLCMNIEGLKKRLGRQYANAYVKLDEALSIIKKARNFM